MPACKPIKIGAMEITRYNSHDPHKFVQELSEMNEKQLYDKCKEFIWFSAYAANNPRSDFHWMCDACYAECKRREKPEIYNRAHEAISRDA